MVVTMLSNYWIDFTCSISCPYVVTFVSTLESIRIIFVFAAFTFVSARLASSPFSHFLQLSFRLTMWEQAGGCKLKVFKSFSHYIPHLRPSIPSFVTLRITKRKTVGEIIHRCLVRSWWSRVFSIRLSSFRHAFLLAPPIGRIFLEIGRLFRIQRILETR